MCLSSFYDDLDSKKVFLFFEEISKIPHGSGNTKQISDYYKDFAISRNLKYYQDSFNNIIIYKEMSNNYSNENYNEPIILQAHLDMVCDKHPDSAKNMGLDGLDLEINGDYLKAKNTSLGADDGIACAMILALLDDDSINCPSMEAIFTSDEEIGLIGVNALDFSKIKGKTLINLDSGEEGVVVVSCAGGNRLDLKIPLSFEEIVKKDDDVIVEIFISGLKGGHSGLEIDKGLANSNKLIGLLLDELSTNLNIKLVDISGGQYDNVIPSDSKISILSKLNDFDEIRSILDSSLKKVNEEYGDVEDDIQIDMTVSDEFICDSNKFNYNNLNNINNINNFNNININNKNSDILLNVLTDESTSKIINFINISPNGICKFSEDVEGLVETSLNLGIIKILENEFVATFAIRSSIAEELSKLNNYLSSLADDFDGSVLIRGSYPSWAYKSDSKIRDTVVSVYNDLYDGDMEITMIHAGLECGIFVNNIPDLDAISIGPSMYDVHSYNEKISISSVDRTYSLILKVLEKLV